MQFKFLYKVDFENGLTENELDYVLTGKFNGEPLLNLDEVVDWKWISQEELKKRMNQNPDSFTFWFAEIMKKLEWR